MQVRYRTLRRVYIKAPVADRDKVVDWCFKNGYRIIRSGPKRIDATQVDTSKYFVIAEKVI